MKTTIGEIAKLVGGTVSGGDSNSEIRGFASLEVAQSDQVSFFGNEKYAGQLAETGAGAVLTGTIDVQIPEGVALIHVENAIMAFDTIIREYGVKPPAFAVGVSETAFVGAGCTFNADKVSISPNATLMDGATIGNGSRIGANTVISNNAAIGENCEIGPNVTVREGCIIGDNVIIHPGVVVGADGFGFEFSDGKHLKIEQLGIVRIENDVEIGANTTIDRARFGETVIGEGTKIDNLVQIGHNCVIGKHCIIVAQTGISGSTRIGNYVTLAAQCGVAGHLSLADQTTFGGRSGVISSVEEPGGTYFGYPARPLKEDRRQNMRIKQLGNLMNRVKALEKKLQED